MAMPASFFLSRVILSVSMMLFIAVCFMHKDIKGQLKRFFSSPLLWSMSLLFVLPLLSGIWTEDKNVWIDSLRIKLPLLFMPLAFAAPFGFSKKEWRWVLIFFIILIHAGTAWSIWQYIGNVDAVNESYLRAKTILTPMGDDHIRFSWLVSVTILFLSILLIEYRKTKKYVSIVAALLIVWLVVYLHLLAARTGLLSFYIMLCMYAAWLMIKKIRLAFAPLILLVVIALPVAAYYVMPTFQNRVKYIMYDSGYFMKAHYLPGGNDAARVISLKAGWHIMQQNPLYGVGFGNIQSEADKWYQQHYPQMIERDQLYPSNEWLAYGAGCGIPGFIIFTVIMLIPFFIQIKNKLVWWMLNATAAFSFLFDIGLEVQFGIAAYCIIILTWWKSQQNAVERNYSY
jgi:hypothetical protein